MSSLTINPKWNSEINQVENGEPITGGVLGNANLASRQLGENIFYLKQKTENDLAAKANKADVYTKTETDNNFAKKATSVSGYGITDAYTKSQIDNLVDSKTGDLTTLKTTDKTQIVKSINEVFVNTKGVVDLYNKNVLAGSVDSWTDLLIKLANGRTQQDKNTDIISVFDYFTKDEKSAYDANNAIDATAAVQRAINSGKNIDLVGRTFYVNNLTQTTNGQCIVSSQGIAKLIKNANGAILTSTASYGFVMHNINWRGNSSTPTYTGDGIVATGDQPQFINCGGRWISGRVLKATGGHVTVLGTCDIYQTTDTTVNGYDIEIGKSGTATLYHQLVGVYTSQKTGGILLIDTGSHSLYGGQIGKLTIKAGTKPSGVNGGMTQGARILGDILIEQSSATFSANQFSDINLAFGAGTSYCIVDASNLYSSGFTSTNNGNGANNIIIQNAGTGADGYAYFKYGVGTSTRSLGFNFTDATRGFKFDGSVILPNSHGIKLADSTSAERIIAILASNDNLTLGTNTGTYTYIQGNNLGLNSAAGTQVRISDGFMAPFSDNSKSLGTAALRWQHGYINNAHFFPLSSVLPTANGEVMLELTNDATLKFKVKGSDGVVRSATLTLA